MRFRWICLAFLFGLLTTVPSPTASGLAAAIDPHTNPAQVGADPTPTQASVGLASSTPMRVTVDVYSGRPNPTWEISPSENEQVRAMLARLIGPTTATYPDWLGYRG